LDWRRCVDDWRFAGGHRLSRGPIRFYHPTMSRPGKEESTPRIANRRAMHDYFITHKIECGMVLVGSEVKSLRAGHAQLHEAFARIEQGTLILHNCHIDPYAKASIVYNHEPRRERKLLVHKRELKKLAAETDNRGTTLIPLAIYFKDGRAKLELGVAQGKQHFDKRATIKKKEQDRELRRTTMSHRQ
jgi:SsrA-binding protein